MSKEKLTFEDGSIYEGDFVKGKKHGKGKYTFPNGNAYEGDFVDDFLHGKEEWIYANKESEVYRHEISPRYKKDDYHFENEYEKKF
jgi:hypothetical protein